MNLHANSILSLILIYVLTITLGCDVRTYPNTDSFVCVCNQLNCDSVNLLPHSLDDHLTIFLTDKSSHRLAKSVIHVNDLAYDSNVLVDVRLAVNRSERQQSIIGFGGAFTDASGINIKKLSSDLVDKLIEDYFGENGLHYSLGRVPIGGTDFSNHPYTYDENPGDYDLSKFALAADDFDYKIPYINKALNLTSELKLFASIWSPPSWLKTNKKINGLGILEGEPEDIAWKTAANYIVKFFQSYRVNGIKFWGLTPENEPMLSLTPGWPTNNCGFTGQMMRDWIKKDLGPALIAAGFTKEQLKMMIYDDNLNTILPFVKSVLDDQKAASFVSGIAFHWYSRGYYDALDEVHKLYPDYFLLSTEACEGFKTDQTVSLGNWTRAENIADDIIEGLNRWSTGWTYWNLVLDTKGGPSWTDNQCDALIIVNSTSNEYYKQPMYYAFGHFSKFLRPGSVHINHTMTIKSEKAVDPKKLKMTTFISPSNELILTILNRHNSTIKLSIDGVVDKQFTLTVVPKSITTLIKPINCPCRQSANNQLLHF